MQDMCARYEKKVESMGDELKESFCMSDPRKYTYIYIHDRVLKYSSYS